jgi:uncharacterized protein YfeS
MDHPTDEGNISEEDHDPFNNPDSAHPRSRELMVEEFLWDCADEEAPFGSDEGWDAYYEFRGWRARNKAKSLTDCLSWIMDGQLGTYTDRLCSDEVIEQDLEHPDEAFLADDFDTFTLDASVIATALGQLLDEGRIDADAKPYVRVAIERQLHPRIVTSEHRREILLAVRRVVDAA